MASAPFSTAALAHSQSPAGARSFGQFRLSPWAICIWSPTSGVAQHREPEVVSLIVIVKSDSGKANIHARSDPTRAKRKRIFSPPLAWALALTNRPQAYTPPRIA